MDYSKVANLLVSLRKEKGYTQKQIAEKMNLSDKTISKWERGQGLPDVSLLSELSRIYGVNIEKILHGDLEEKDADGGNMKRIKFYVCKNCGNIITSTSDAEVSCCGRRIEALVPMAPDDAHKINVVESGFEYYVSIQHEMTKAHYISFVAFATYDQVIIKKLYPEQNAEFFLPRVHRGQLYAYCSEHGLWMEKR